MAASLTERVRTHRLNLRAAGLRPIQVWVPDTRRAGFAAECARQSKIVRESATEKDLTGFIEHASEDAWE